MRRPATHGGGPDLKHIGDDRRVILQGAVDLSWLLPAMNVSVLIDSIVRQVTVLIAQLATAGGIRAPVAHIANQVFVQLARELEAQGVSRKVSADMFGMALRAYVRKLRRLGEAETEPGTTLWQAVLDFVRGEKLVARQRVMQRFLRDDERQVSSVLFDLTQSGLVFASGSGDHAVYRAASEEELGELASMAGAEGLEELLWVLVYREGPFTQAELGARLGRSEEELAPVLAQLIADGRVRRAESGRLEALEFVIPLGSKVGWEAAVFDHVQAVVQTIAQRLSRARDDEDAASVGGSTYSFDLWPGHPMEREIKGQLQELRQRLGALRQRLEQHNAAAGVPSRYQQVVTYVGQCILEREADTGESQHGAEDHDVE